MGMRPKSVLRRDLVSQLLQRSHSDTGRQEGRTSGRKLGQLPTNCQRLVTATRYLWAQDDVRLSKNYSTGVTDEDYLWSAFILKLDAFFETIKALFLCSETVTGFLVNSWKTTIYQKCRVISKLSIALFAFVYLLVLLLIYWSSTDWTQGLEQTRQELYHWAASPALSCLFFYFSF